MRKRYIGLLIVSIVVSFTFGFTIRQMIHSNNVVYDYEAFYKYIEKINRKFEVTGYTQILKDTDSVVAVPDSLFGRQDFDKGLYSRQKSFFFKNKDNGVVILLSVSACKTELTPSWTSSIGYTTSLYNQPEGRFKDTYSKWLSSKWRTDFKSFIML